MKRSKKLKLKLIFGFVFTVLWIIIGIIIMKIFDLNGWGWLFIFFIIFMIPFAKFTADSKWIYEEYSELKNKEDFDKLLKK